MCKLCPQKPVQFLDECWPSPLSIKKQMIFAFERHELGVRNEPGKLPALVERDDVILAGMENDCGTGNTSSDIREVRL
ncbi:MAG TPA: hypothetical protein VHN11_06560, partial [Xanthobacteraceae bacterium]|nr:hypothetical protein [Xanthobacteraceae bacterium]